MKHTLMHKNVEVLHFDIIKKTGVITEVYAVVNENHLPFEMINKPVDIATLNTYFLKRAIPSYRNKLRKSLKIIGEDNTQLMLLKSRALSLVDYYWIKTKLCARKT